VARKAGMRCEALRPDGTWDLTLAIPGVFMPPSVADEEGDGRDSGRIWVAI